MKRHFTRLENVYVLSLNILSLIVVSLALAQGQFTIEPKYSAFSLIKTIDWMILFSNIGMSACISFIVVAIRNSILDLLFPSEIHNFNELDFTIAYLVFAVLTVYNLLKQLTVEQFGLLATVITLPVFIIFPKVIKIIFKIIQQHKSKRYIKDKPKKDDK